MLKGVEKAVAAIATTLGPKGRNVIIDQPYGAPKVTKDGVTVAKAIEFTLAYMSAGLMVADPLNTPAAIPERPDDYCLGA